MDASIEKKGYLHFLSVSPVSPPAREKLEYEMRLRRQVSSMYQPSMPQWEWPSKILDIMQIMCEGSTTNATYAKNPNDNDGTCLDKRDTGTSRAYRGTRADCEGVDNGHIYVPRRDQLCKGPHGEVLATGTSTSKFACEGDTTVRVYTPAIEATCVDASGTRVGNATSLISCEGQATGHTFTPPVQKNLVRERSTKESEGTVWPCTGEASGSVPAVTSDCQADTGLSQSLDSRARGVVAVSELLLSEESMRAHTLNAMGLVC